MAELLAAQKAKDTEQTGYVQEVRRLRAELEKTKADSNTKRQRTEYTVPLVPLSGRASRAFPEINTPTTPTTSALPSTPTTVTEAPLIATLRKALTRLAATPWQPVVVKTTDTVKLATFLARFENCIQVENGTPQQMLRLIPSCITGQAFEWWKLLTDDDPAKNSWNEFKDAMVQHFEPRVPLQVVLQSLRTCRKNMQETYNVHLIRFNGHLQEMKAGSMSNVTVIATYLDCLDPDVVFNMRTTHHQDLEDMGTNVTLAQVCVWASTAEQRLRSLASSRKSALSLPISGHHSHNGAVFPSRPFESMPSSPSPLALPSVSPNYQGKNPNPNFRANQSKNPAAAPQQGMVPPTAATAGSGTFRPGPASANNTSGTGTSVKSQLTGAAALHCYGCGQTGHFKRNCPHKGTAAGSFPAGGVKPELSSG